MSLLKQVKTGVEEKPYFLCIYSPPGVGKTTWAAQAPNALIICGESGADYINAAKTPKVKSWDELNKYLDELSSTPHDYRTVVVDGLDSLEILLHDKLKGDSKSMNLAMGGYGAAYKSASEEWDKFLVKARALRDTKGLNVILIGHSTESEKIDPLVEKNYFQYNLNLHDGKNASSREIILNGVDAVLFANYDVYAVGDGKQVRGKSSGARVLYSQYSPAYVAKNRYGLPPELPLSWDAFDSAVKGAGVDNTTIVAELLTISATLTDEAIKKKVIETIGKEKNNRAKLFDIKSRLERMAK